MILHILPDDKFIVRFCTMAMEAAPSGVEQIFLVRDTKPYKYLPEDAPYLVEAPIGSEAFKRLTESMGKGDRIIIHFMHPKLREWLGGFDSQASIEWVFWSSDFYNFMVFDFQDQDPITYAFLHQYQRLPLSRFKLLHWYRSWLRKQEYQKKRLAFNKTRDATIRKISVFHHYIKEEYELIERTIPMKAKFNYFCYSQDIPYDEIYTLSGKLNIASAPVNPNEPNLIVGHCGYPYVNHLDSFEFLKDKAKGLNIVAPLSYGDDIYIKEVLSAGAKIFDNRFLPLMEYMDFKQYLTLLMACNGMFIDLNPPKAMGNLHTLLLLGKRVFIKRESLAYQYFNRIGITVNATDEFSKELLIQPEDPEVVARNVGRILEMHSHEKHYLFVKNMINLIP